MDYDFEKKISSNVNDQLLSIAICKVPLLFHSRASFYLVIRTVKDLIYGFISFNLMRSVAFASLETKTKFLTDGKSMFEKKKIELLFFLPMLFFIVSCEGIIESKVIIKGIQDNAYLEFSMVESNFSLYGGNSPSQTVTIKLKNIGSSQSEFIEIENTNDQNFEVFLNDCDGKTLSPSQECYVQIRGKANRNDKFIGQLKVDANNAPVVSLNLISSGFPLDCPSGFTEVKGNTILGTSSFCVMKFEAKNENGAPVSQPSGYPWVNINASDAQDQCESIDNAGYAGEFSLISNAEWMTIAYDLEGVPSNWSSGTIGSGYISRGHSDGAPNSSLFVGNELDPYDGTGNSSSQGDFYGWSQRRFHTLSNGSIIWDFSGNVWEWVDWDRFSASYSIGPTDAVSGLKELSVLDGSILAKELQSNSGYTSAQFFGRWRGGSGGGVFRGGFWASHTDSGVLSLNLAWTPLTIGVAIGFRCVYRP